jgi:hypothetical protein
MIEATTKIGPTMNNPTTIRTLALLVIVIAACTGCGGSEPTEPGPTPQLTVDAAPDGSPVPTPTPAPPETSPPPVVPAQDQLPPGFPLGVPTPALPMLSAVGADATFTLRFTTTDARTDIANYGKVLERAGFMKTGEVDALEGQQRSLTITAMTETAHVEASAYGPDADDGGNYMEVIIETS